MTNTLSPRQIDELERRLENDDLLVRALAYSKAKREAEHAKVMSINLDRKNKKKRKSQPTIQPKEVLKIKTLSKPRLSKKTGLNPRTKFYCYRGKFMSISELSIRENINIHTLRTRLQKGWTVENAVEKARYPKHTKRRGEVETSFDDLGTGEGPSTQERPEMGFFPCA